jgi:diguanylate cyclase (GGDEF)-like protein
MLQMVTNLGSIAIMNTRNVGRLRDQANHDGLTRLLNKRHFMQRLGILIHNAEREGQTLGLFIFDIDHFKHYNDTNGHPAGDEVLRGVAKVLQASLRPGDMACRYGGEEFVVAMPKATAAVALQVAQRIREAVCSHPFPHGERQPKGRLTISGGVSVFPVDGSTTTDLVLHADQALYQAKAAGRDQVKVHEGVTIGESRGNEQDDAWQLDPPSTVEL